MAPRRHQIENQKAAREVLKGVSPIRRVVNLVTPGGGKSAIPPIYAATLIPAMADRICWVVPRDSLRVQAEQAFGAQWLREWLDAMRQVRAAANGVDPSRGSHGYVTTYQAVSANPELHRMEFERFRYILVLDEVHHVEEGGSWHRALQPLVDSAVLVVLLTGTVERGDAGRVPFLDYRETSSGEVPDLSSAPERKIITYSRTDALAEQAILPITFKHLDFGGSWRSADGELRSVESFDAIGMDESSDAVHAALSTDYANDLLDKCAREWKAYSSTRPLGASQLLVVAHSQSAAKRHLERLREVHRLKADVAVSDDGAEAQKRIAAFRARRLDCLVTVGMAYEGLDVPGITHLACLTHIRSKPWVEQMFGRLVRVDRESGLPWSAQQVFAYVPDDPVMREVIEQIRSEQVSVLRREVEESGEAGEGETPKEERRDIIPLSGSMSGERESLLDGEAVSREETERLQAAMEAAGVAGRISVGEFRRAMLLAQAGAPVRRREIQAPTASLIESKSRQWIEATARKHDIAMKWAFGSTNRMLIKHFGKPRDEMTNEELGEVIAYLNRMVEGPRA